MPKEDPRGRHRWVLCIPKLCMYADVCTARSDRQRYVLQRLCARHQPIWERPPAGLSPLSREILGEMGVAVPLHRGAFQGADAAGP